METAVDGKHDTSWKRHPADLARLVVSVATVAALSVLAWAYDRTSNDVSTDLLRLLGNIPDRLVLAVVGLVQLVVTGGMLVAALSLVARQRWRLVGLVALASGTAVGVMALLAGAIRETIPAELTRNRVAQSWLGSGAYPSAGLLAAGAAVVTVTTPFTRESWRKMAWATVVTVAFLRVLTATEMPVNLVLILAVGSAVGSAVLLVVGAPRRSVDPHVIAEALARSGLEVSGIEAVGDQRAAPAFRVRHPGAPDTNAVLLGRDQRDHDLLLRVWRSLRVKGFNERRPLVSPRRAAEHEELVVALAAAAGVSTTLPVAVAITDDEAAIVATTWAEGRPLELLAPEAITDHLLVAVWGEVAKLHARRIAHRRLTLDSFVVDGDRPVMVGFRWGTINADDDLLGADVVELMACTAAQVGVERAVRAAHAGLGRAPLLATLGMFQPLVLSAASRERLEAAQISVGELREEVRACLGADEVELVPLRRVTLKGAVSMLGSVVLASYVLSLASDWRNIVDALTQMSWVAVPVLLAIMFVGNAGGVITLMGSVTTELPFLRTSQIMFAQGFLNRFTPANSGGMALRARYLQRQGVDLATGAGAVGLTTVASGLVQVLFVVAFLSWGGSADQLSNFTFPSITKTLTIVVALAAVGGVIALSGWGRREVVPRVRLAFGPAVDNLVRLSQEPSKLAQLFGGCALSKLASIASFAVSISALGIHMSFPRTAALYLVASTVGSAVPTPGGVGGIEAALTAALISAGVDPATAGAGVLIFRLFTFWLPTLPGWLCLQQAQRSDIV